MNNFFGKSKAGAKLYEHCRLYPEVPLKPFFALGDQAPANSLRQNKNDSLPAFPLTLAWSEKARSPQLSVTVDPSYLFEHYLWVTGTSTTANQYSQQFFKQVLNRLQQESPRRVLEVASNDGTFLKPFQQNGFAVVGVDPAKNVAEQASKDGIPTVAEFFTRDVAATIVKKQGSMGFVFARNVLPHVNDPRGIIDGMAEALDEKGIGAIEFHHAEEILEGLHYDSIYHEHVFFYSLTTVVAMLREAGLHPFDVTRSPISGGSLVLYFGKTQKSNSPLLEQILNSEINSAASFSRWQKFARASEAHAKKLRELVDSEVSAGRKLIGYGASARSSTMLNFAGINFNQLAAIADQSPWKHQRYTAGTDVIILPPNEALALKPDTVVLLAWNFEAEIRGRLRELGFKGRVIVPLPSDPRMLEAA